MNFPAALGPTLPAAPPAQAVQAAQAAQAAETGEWASAARWWPLAAAAEVAGAGRTPVPVTLLSVPWAIVVLDGKICALRDVCPHRRVPLSAGTVADSPRGQLLECGYHGWSFGADGVCARIPALGDGVPPRGMGGTPVLATNVHAGLVWGTHGTSPQPDLDLDLPAALPLDSRRVAAPAVEVVRALAGTGAVPGRVLRVPGSEPGLAFAIRPETASSSVVFRMTQSASSAGGLREWRRVLDDDGPATRVAPAQQDREER
jgi:nitrite reductase/ring-hydroxylating ferredoxin subunit